MTPCPIIYNLFPLLAGPFEQWTPHLERARDLGFNHLYFNPVSYPGFSGSLYSVQDYYGFHPLLAPKGNEAGARAFRRMLERARALGLTPMMDLVINHTAIDSPLIREHPAWFERDAEGKVANPWAMDGERKVVWGDLATVDNGHSSDRDALWEYWDRLIAHHQALGISGFRCDAAYQVPVELWRHLTGRARARDPDAAFYAENLGCPFEQGLALADAGFAYLFNSSAWWDLEAPWCLEQYEVSRHRAQTISFAENHDTPRLAADAGGDAGRILARYAFSALFATGVMMTMGFEFGAVRPLHVVRTRPEDWDAPQDLTGAVREINRLKLRHHLFQEEGPVTQLDSSADRVTALRKDSVDRRLSALLLISRTAGKGVPQGRLPGWEQAEEITPQCLLERGAPMRVLLRTQIHSTHPG